MRADIKQSCDFAHGVKISLTPGFSPVFCGSVSLNRFSGFAPEWKPLKRLPRGRSPYTGLKPGVNEMDDWRGLRFLRA